MRNKLCPAACLIFLFFGCIAYPQRSEINKGVDLYDEEKYSDAEINFKKGLEEAPESFEAVFNLGDSYYKQGRYEDALKSFNSSIEMTENNELKAKVHHNIGNSLLKSQKIPESVEAYKNALKLNPGDRETKYNLSYALSLLEDQKNQQQNKNDQNKNDQKDQQNKDQQQNRDNRQKDQDKNQNKPDQQQEAQQDNLKQPKQEISKEEAERILQALRNEEKDLQKKLRKKIGNPVRREKDW